MIINRRSSGNLSQLKIIPICLMAALCSSLWTRSYASDEAEELSAIRAKKVWFVGIGLGAGSIRRQSGSEEYNDLERTPYEGYGIYSICAGRDWNRGVWNKWITQLVLRTDPRNDWKTDNRLSLTVNGYWNPYYHDLLQPLVGAYFGQGYQAGMIGFRLGIRSDFGNNWSLRYGLEAIELDRSFYLGYSGRGGFAECVYHIK
jgi:hypothetical protein